MTYMVIPAGEPRPQIHDEPLTLEEVARLVGGTPAMVPTSLSDHVALWVNQDAATLSLPRNVLGTVMASYVFAPRQPYAGTVVVASARKQAGRPVPGPLAFDLALAIDTGLHDAAVVLGLIDDDLDTEMPAHMYGVIRKLADMAMNEPLAARP